jgi:chromosomal replication initiation ATPase DnaA
MMPASAARPAGAAQFVFDLSLPPALSAEDFVVAVANRAAVERVAAWRDWSSPVLLLAGPPGSGKSHLAAIWREGAGAALLSPADLDTLDPSPSSDRPLVLDDADAVSGHAGRERALFHLFNAVADRQNRLLLTASRPAARWPIGLPDLASRLRAAPMVLLEPPDEDLVTRLLAKLFADRQLAVAPAIVAFAALRLERSFDAVRTFVAAVDRESLARGRAVTIPLVRAILARADAGDER